MMKDCMAIIINCKYTKKNDDDNDNDIKYTKK